MIGDKNSSYGPIQGIGRGKFTFPSAGHYFCRRVSVFITCCILLTVTYALLMVVYCIGWNKQPAFRPGGTFQPATAISVIIPARNEATNIEACICSVLAQHYPAPLFEIIVVDDHSEDGTATLAGATSERVQVISLKDMLHTGDVTHSYKKKALTAGVAAARGELIITTDADCLAPPDWLTNMAALYERTQAAMIIGPVTFTAPTGLLALFQSLDFTAMQGITAAAHRLRMGSMSNGANLAFSRAAFEAVDGYTGIDHLASGDDYLLLHKMQQHFPNRIHYLRSQEAVIHTAPQPTWNALLQQRIRWASKSGKYADHRLTAILLLVYLFNALIAAAAVAGFWQPVLRAVAAEMLIVKIVMELLFLIPVADFFKRRKELWFFPWLQPLHIFYIILAGFLGFVGSYRWKGRRIK